jgi:hypothetical protein
MDRQQNGDLTKRLNRLTIIGSVAALAIAWATLIPLILSGPMPAHFTWPVILAFPPTFFGWLVGVIVLTGKYPRHSLAVIFGVSFVVVAIAVALIAFFTPGGLNGSADLPWQ